MRQGKKMAWLVAGIGAAGGAAAVTPLAGADEERGTAASSALEQLMLDDFRAPVASVAQAQPRARGAVADATPRAFSLDTVAGPVRAAAGPTLAPARTSASSTAVFAGREGADLGLRETPVGVRSYVQLRGSRSFSWTLSLPGAERVVRLRDGGLGLLAPARRVGNRGSSSPALPRGWRLVATASAPAARDSAGRRVRSALRAKGDEVTLRVARASAPVVARMAWAPTGDVGGGWWGYGADKPLESTTWSVQRGKRTRSGGCGYTERGTLAPGEIEEARDAAVSKRGCRALVETGSERQPAATASASAVMAAARRVHRNKAWYKNMQEDPVQIDVNSVKDVVDFRWNRRCVRPLRMYDATDAYGPTGWSLVKRQPLRSRRCKETTMQTYAKFTGGQYFPPCTFFKVTTIYANNIVQGFPSGRGGYHVYRVTGGPPCHKLLHWDRRRGNKRIY